MGNSITRSTSETFESNQYQFGPIPSSATDPNFQAKRLQNNRLISNDKGDNNDIVTGQQQIKSRWSFGNFVNSTLYNPSLRVSQSIQNFSFARFRSKSTSKLSSVELSSQTKTHWPNPTIVKIFLPQFKLVSREHLGKKYRLNGVVARGAFGQVYKAIDVDEQREYAIKVLSKAQIIRDNAVRQLKHEVDIQTICGHNSFIVKCLAFWQTHREIYLLAELINGGELFQRIEKFSLQLIQLYIAEIAIALDFLHNAGVIYRDLKPENILLDDNLHIKLTDFGLSKWLKIGQRTNTICGTLEYMAPEILNGESYGHAVDWYALGVVACRMYTNEYPILNVRPKFIAPSTNADEVDNIRMMNIPSISASNDVIASSQECDKKTQLPAAASNLPNECKDVLLRLLEFTPEKRIRSIFGIQRIALYKGYNFDDVRKRKVDPRAFILHGDGVIV